MYFASNRPGTLGALDLWVSARATTADSWFEPQNLGPGINTATSADAGPSLSFDGTALYFQSVRPEGFGAFDLYVARRTKLNANEKENENENENEEDH